MCEHDPASNTSAVLFSIVALQGFNNENPKLLVIHNLHVMSPCCPMALCQCVWFCLIILVSVFLGLDMCLLVAVL